MEGRIFGDVPINLELRLSVEDSPNSGGCAIDAIRVCKLALDRGIAGPLIEISAYTMKHPPIQYPDDVAKAMVEDFIAGNIVMGAEKKVGIRVEPQPKKLTEQKQVVEVYHR
jgi:myo-inositol-1-phosphate synthase